ncbi:MAG: hypothetical protein IBJ11_02075 [Phycisphaerales bacterium]|nr:hypothetical protein [Phycisphaerales bacterium]
MNSRDRIEFRGLAFEYAGQIDRFTYFGPAGGPNMLFVKDLSEGPPADGGYRFYGGAYTWISPQKGELGWIAPDGTRKDWPPDPAMDRGPATVTGRGTGVLTSLGPVNRMGLREEKTFRITADSTAELLYSLENSGAAAVRAGTWVNTAARATDRLAVRIPAGAGVEVTGWDERSVKSFRSVLGQPDEKGWCLVDLPRAGWRDGIKVYITPTPAGASAGDLRPEIAIWNAGYWLHRAIPGVPGDAAGFEALKAAGEGPVAIYIQPGANPGDWLVEAELYGPLVEIAPGGRHTSTERWTLIRSPRPETSTLP